jgi:hypothetical protein
MLNGNSRSKNGIRFGQYLWFRYDLDAVFSERNAGLDGYNAEEPEVAYNQIKSQIQQ